MAKSKSDLIRMLSRKFPDPEEAAKLLDELPYEKDRSMALVYAAFLDALLQRLIIATLPPLRPKLEGRLFTDGPLGDLDSKILIAEALGAIPFAGEIVPALNSIKHIRNVFGHSPIDVSFETEEIAYEIETNLLPFAISCQNEIRETIPPAERRESLQFTNKRTFYYVGSTLCSILDNAQQKITGTYLLGQYTWL